jgi:hypothetical protein
MQRTFEDDDWTRHEHYFTEDAVYSTLANAMRTVGRSQLLEVLRAAISGFDRRCDSRRLVTTEGPTAVGNEVRRKWSATFTVAGAPRLEIDVSERAEFCDERIELLEVTLTPETLAKLVLGVAITPVSTCRQ